MFEEGYSLDSRIFYPYHPNGYQEKLDYIFLPWNQLVIGERIRESIFYVWGGYSLDSRIFSPYHQMVTGEKRLYLISLEPFRW